MRTAFVTARESCVVADFEVFWSSASATLNVVMNDGSVVWPDRKWSLGGPPHDVLVIKKELDQGLMDLW